MTFGELLDQACTAAHLPSMAKDQLPSALSDKTKRKLLKLSPEEVGRVLNTAIDAVNLGSIESVDTLVIKQLRNNNCL